MRRSPASFMTFVAEAVFSSPGGGGFLMARPAGQRHLAAVRLLHRDAAQAPAGERGRVLPDLRRFRPRQAGVPYRARLERHARRGAWPVCHSRSALHAADEAPGRAGGARGTRRLPAERVPGLSLHRHRPDPDRQRKRRAHLRAARQADAGGRDLPQRGACRTLEWLAEDGARLFLDGDVGQAIVDASRCARRPSHPSRSQALPRRAARAALLATRRRDAWPSIRRRRRAAR